MAKRNEWAEFNKYADSISSSNANNNNINVSSQSVSLQSPVTNAPSINNNTLIAVNLILAVSVVVAVLILRKRYPRQFKMALALCIAAPGLGHFYVDSKNSWKFWMLFGGLNVSAINAATNWSEYVVAYILISALSAFAMGYRLRPANKNVEGMSASIENSKKRDMNLITNLSGWKRLWVVLTVIYFGFNIYLTATLPSYPWHNSLPEKLIFDYEWSVNSKYPGLISNTDTNTIYKIMPDGRYYWYTTKYGQKAIDEAIKEYIETTEHYRNMIKINFYKSKIYSWILPYALVCLMAWAIQWVALGFKRSE